ncbi:hypothetical protein QYE76_069943 [Lolium multiflorum]|uniref:Peptidase M24 domain-containing protein n=1 Tax=Lolium multiflorum TaxID=4521 RepID=A0AAD8SIZ5_LOLMU|nr:hypothetical protein QYE76_069943 [Lolium multiflorum]
MRHESCLRTYRSCTEHCTNIGQVSSQPSVNKNEIDSVVHHMIVEAGAYPSPLGYGRFPKSISTSVNECVCDGLPDSKQPQNGDIINIDVNVFLNTSLCGEADESIRHFVETKLTYLDGTFA